jgi:PilZ domain
MASEAESKTRRGARSPARLALMLIIDADGEKVESPARAYDFSQFGLGVKAGAPLVPGQIVDVIPNEGPEYRVRSRVIWVGEAESDKGGKAGLEFLQPLPAPA